LSASRQRRLNNPRHPGSIVADSTDPPDRKMRDRKKENTMTSRTIRIAIILIIIQSLLSFPAPVSRAQDDPTELLGVI